MRLLSRGQQDLADVTWHVTDYATAPTPDAIILDGESRRWNPANVLHYADGQSRKIPVVLERQIDNWVQEQPAPLFEAGIA